MIEGNDPLAVVLSDVAALGTDRDRAQIAAVHDRLVSARLRVLVAGEAKRGKSSLVNAFLGQAVLPVGVTPLTAVATTVRYGHNPHVHVRFADGRVERHPHAALDDLVTEHGNPTCPTPWPRRCGPRPARSSGPRTCWRPPRCSWSS